MDYNSDELYLSDQYSGDGYYSGDSDSYESQNSYYSEDSGSYESELDDHQKFHLIEARVIEMLQDGRIYNTELANLYQQRYNESLTVRALGFSSVVDLMDRYDAVETHYCVDRRAHYFVLKNESDDLPPPPPLPSFRSPSPRPPVARCYVCDIKFDQQCQYDEHVAGNRHARNLQAQRMELNKLQSAGQAQNRPAAPPRQEHTGRRHARNVEAERVNRQERRRDTQERTDAEQPPGQVRGVPSSWFGSDDRNSHSNQDRRNSDPRNRPGRYHSDDHRRNSGRDDQASSSHSNGHRQNSQRRDQPRNSLLNGRRNSESSNSNEHRQNPGIHGSSSANSESRNQASSSHSNEHRNLERRGPAGSSHSNKRQRDPEGRDQNQGDERKQDEVQGHEENSEDSQESQRKKRKVDESKDEIQKLKRELGEVKDQLEKKTLCQICMARERDTILLPCCHFLFCSRCASRTRNCATCRKVVKMRHKVFV